MRQRLPMHNPQHYIAKVRHHFEEDGPTRGENKTAEIRNMASEVAATIPHDRDTLFLDLGCGDGAIIHAVSALRPRIRFIGMDLAFHQLVYARKSELAVVQAGAPAFPFRAETFDLVVSFSFLQYIPLNTYGRLMLETARILKPGGRAHHLGVPNLHHYWRANGFPRCLISYHPWRVFTHRLLRIRASKPVRDYWWSKSLISRHTPDVFTVEYQQNYGCWYRMDVKFKKRL